jgi:hypothetical protein
MSKNKPMKSVVTSDIFRDGYFTIYIPKEELEADIYNFKVYVPKSELADQSKTGKIGSYQIQILPEGKLFGKPLKEIPILRSLLAKYTTIDLIVKEN